MTRQPGPVVMVAHDGLEALAELLVARTGIAPELRDVVVGILGTLEPLPGDEVVLRRELDRLCADAPAEDEADRPW